MSTPFIGEIRMFGGTFAILGWAFCNGQSIPISQNDALFALIGTTYGGDGVQTFNLPDFRGRLPVHQGNLTGGGSYVMGQAAGTENVTLTTAQIGAHNHNIASTNNAGTSPSPVGNIPAQFSPNAYASGAPLDGALAPPTIGLTGGNGAHSNMMPYLCVTFIIAMEGIFPSRN